MAGRWLAAVLVGAVLIACGCGKKKGTQDEEGDRDAVSDPNAAVAAEYWGEERVVYADDVEWRGVRMVPAGEQGDSPPTDRVYVKFVYSGPKLVRIEGIDPEGEPWHVSKLGVRMEWMYAAHGGVVEQVAYEADGEVTVREQYGYDEAGRCIARTMWESGEKRNRSTYLYGEDGLTRTDRMEVYDPDGTVFSVQTNEERWDPGLELWEPVEG